MSYTNYAGTMSYTNYRDMRTALRERASFEGNSASAVRITSNSVPHVNYSVYSYETLILREVDGAVTYWDSARYSNTTSRLQRMLASIFPVEVTR